MWRYSIRSWRGETWMWIKVGLDVQSLFVFHLFNIFPAEWPFFGYRLQWFWKPFQLLLTKATSPLFKSYKQCTSKEETSEKEAESYVFKISTVSKAQLKGLSSNLTLSCTTQILFWNVSLNLMLTFRPIDSFMRAITFSVRKGHLLVEEYLLQFATT